MGRQSSSGRRQENIQTVPERASEKKNQKILSRGSLPLLSLGFGTLFPLLYSTAKTAWGLRIKEDKALESERMEGEAYPAHLSARDEKRTMEEVTALIEDIPMRPRSQGGVIPTILFSLPDIIPMLLACRKRTAGLVYRYPPAFERITIESEDGTPLPAVVGLHKDERPRPALIMVHGLFGSKNLWFSEQVALSAYYGWGYQALALDLRFFGESKKLSSAPGTGGWKEGQDILAAARYLKSLPLVTSVGVMGGSMGAASAMLAAAQDREGLLDGGVIAWHGYGDVESMVRFISTPPWPWKPFFSVYPFFKACFYLTLGREGLIYRNFESYMINHSCEYYGVKPEELWEKSSPALHLHEVNAPTLIINSDNDPVIPSEQAELLEKEARGREWVKMLRFPVGGHCAFAWVDRKWMSHVVRTFYDYWAWL